MSKVDEMRALREKKFAAMQAAKNAPATAKNAAAAPAKATPTKAPAKAPAKTAATAPAKTVKAPAQAAPVETPAPTDGKVVSALTTAEQQISAQSDQPLTTEVANSLGDAKEAISASETGTPVPPVIAPDVTKYDPAKTDATQAAAPSTSPTDEPTCTAVDKQGRRCSREPNHAEKYHRYVDANANAKPDKAKTQTAPDGPLCGATDKQGRTCSREKDHSNKYHRYV